MLPLLFGSILMGLVIGYVVELLVRYLPTGSLNAKCKNCETNLEFRNNPFFIHRCPQCKSLPPLRPFLILVISLICAVYIGIIDPLQNLAISWAVLCYLMVIVFIDIEHHLILHTTTLFGVFFATFVGTALHGFKSSMLGGAFGLLFIGLFYILGVYYAKYKSRKLASAEAIDEALGFGDVTLATVLGILLGHLTIFSALTLGIFLAGGFSLIMIAQMLFQKKFTSQLYIPYGPFLVLGAAYYLFF